MFKAANGGAAGQRRSSGFTAFVAAITAFAGLGPGTAVAGPSGPAAAAVAAASPRVEAAVHAALASGEHPTVLVRFKGEADLSAAYALPLEQRAPYVYRTLSAFAGRQQGNARQLLTSRFSLSEARRDYDVLWIDNSIAISRLTGQMLSSLQADPSVESIETEKIIPPPPMPAAAHAARGDETDTVVPSMAHIQVPAVWAEGFHGEGIVVANIDTGVRYTHHALVSQYRGNLGAGTFDHNRNWYDPYNHSSEPRQTANHGSHTMGTMVGDNADFFADPADRRRIGAAPQAKWIACLGVGATGGSNIALIKCGQWTLAPFNTDGSGMPDPTRHADIVNNSWGYCASSYDAFFESVIIAWVAAGIAPTFSNGNSTNCGYPDNPPLNTVGTPARSGKILGVGATGTDDGVYAPFSVKGVTDDKAPGLPAYPNPRGFPDLKPNLVAPGVNILSVNSAGDDEYFLDSGTSMAAPAVAGVIALMWSAAPCMKGNYAATGTILMSTATPIPVHTGSPSDGPGDVPNQATGWGEVNAVAAVNQAVSRCGSGGRNGVYRSPVLNRAVQPTASGISLNVVNGLVDGTGPLEGDWDQNFSAGAGALRLASVDTHGNRFVTAGASIAALHVGDRVGPESTFQAGSGSGTPAAEWLGGTDAYAGFRFDCDGRLAFPVAAGVCYGYVHITTGTANGLPATILDYVYDGDGQPITIGADEADNDGLFCSGFEDGEEGSCGGSTGG